MMFNIEEVKELIKAVDESNLDEFKFEQEGTKLLLKKNPQQVIEVAKKEMSQVEHVPSLKTVENNPTPVTQSGVELETAPSAKANTHTIVSPMVGTFYQAPSPDSDPYVEQGDIIQEDSVVCIIEAMKLMNEIESEVKGKVVEVLAENGELVEYGQPLVVVELV